MKRSLKTGCTVLCAAMLMTGCGDFDAMPEMTKEQTSLIAEVSAGLLAQSDKNASTLVKDWVIVAHDEREALKQANLERVLAQKEEAAEAEEAAEGKEGSGSGSGDAEQQASFEGIAQFCGVDDKFEIEYAGLYLTQSYPENGDPADTVFNISADGDNQLMVVQFTAVNLTEEEQTLDLFDSGVTFKLSTDDGKPKSVLTTLLPDDMSLYEGKIPGQESVKLVLIQELTPEEVDAATNLVLTMENISGATTSTLLQAGHKVDAENGEDAEVEESATEESVSTSEQEDSGIAKTEKSANEEEEDSAKADGDKDAEESKSSEEESESKASGDKEEEKNAPSDSKKNAEKKTTKKETSASTTDKNV